MKFMVKDVNFGQYLHHDNGLCVDKNNSFDSIIKARYLTYGQNVGKVERFILHVYW